MEKMKAIQTLEIKSVREGQRPLRLCGVTKMGYTLILTGRKKKPDIMHFSGGYKHGDDYSVMVQGLYHGTYGDAEVMASDLIKGLEEIGSEKDASSIKELKEIWLS